MSSTDRPESEPTLEEDRTIARALRQGWGAFFQRFGRLTDVQRAVIPLVLDGRDVLVCSATASGKTEAACAPLIERRLRRRHPWTILYVSPTRALVNDLFERLRRPCEYLRLRLVRRTGEHRGALDPAPHLLITTPESFDSLLCRGRIGNGHLLGAVDAVVLDEIHLLHGTARGEQLRWLLERLRRVRALADQRQERASSGIQLVALSATVADPTAVCDSYLTQGRIVQVPGSRTIEPVGLEDSEPSIEAALPAYLHSLEVPEKILVFANARRRVDALAGTLAHVLRNTGYRVAAHHGSLSQREREDAEALLQRSERAVVVATSTLEIGVDIGDIDLVVLDGPAPDMPSLLQRIGRGNRRSGRTRVMACANTPVEAFIQAAMISAAEDGWLGDQHFGPHPAVVRQQTASYILQSSRRERSRQRLEDLFEALGDAEISRRIMRQMLVDEELEEGPSGVRLSGPWLDRVDRGEIHSTIDDSRGATVVDAESGAAIATGVEFLGGRSLGVGGHLLRVREWSEWKVLVKKDGAAVGVPGEWRYAARPWMLGPGQGQAVRRYLELDPTHWPLVRVGSRVLVLHLGGGRRRAFLDLLREPGDGFVVTDWLIRCDRDPEEIRLLLASRARSPLRPRLADRLETVERRLGLSRQNRLLPADVRLETAHRWLGVAEETAQLEGSQWRAAEEEATDRMLIWFGSALIDGP